MLYGYLNSSFVSNPFSDTAIPPSNLTSPVISGSGIVGQTLSTTNGTWSGTLPITFAYQWNRNGSVIVGATNNTYVLVTADASTSITCTVTATNAGGFASSTSNAISVAAAGDADANAFIAAAAITDTTQKAAIDKLVVDLKRYGIWTKMKALYPFVGGTASQHKFNLRNPLDTDAAFRLVFNGGWTHSSTGALPNGVNGFADTFLNPSISLAQNSTHLSYYSRSNILNINTIEMGVFPLATSGVGASCFGISQAAAPVGHFRNRVSTSTASTGYIPTNTLGLFVSNRDTSTQQKVYKNGVLQETANVNSNGIANLNVVISAFRTGANEVYDYSAKQTAFNSIGDGLTDTEAANYYTAVQTFQTTLGRNVGVPIVADADAQAFLNAAVITDTTQASAVNTLVTDLKGYGIWSKMKAIYPFVGGVASSHKYNLRNPLDTDAAFRLVFNGGATHDSTGITGNGVNAYANTFLNDTALSIDNKHIAIYQRNILSNLSGAQVGLTPANRFYLNYQGTNYSNIGMNAPVTTVTAPQRGMFLLSKVSNGSYKYYQNSLTPISKTGTNFAQSTNHFILAQNNGTAAVDHSLTNLSLVSFGDGLSDLEYTNYKTAVTTFQTTLSRNV